MNSKVVSINLYAIFMLFIVVFLLREAEMAQVCNLAGVVASCQPSLKGPGIPTYKCCTILQGENKQKCLCGDLRLLRDDRVNLNGIKNVMKTCNLTSFDYKKCLNK
ncbi:hypothetical protein OROGR_018181 [Orobanche gracilis]